jgi:hypothetical protein
MKAQQTSDDLKEIQNGLIGYAIEVAENYNLELDYSDESIKTVEIILGKIHEAYMNKEIESGLNGLALEFGFYIMKVIEKNHGPAYFERNHKDFGDNSFPFYWRESTLFVYGWCQKRILDGEGDNVWLKYKTIILNTHEEK